MNLKRNMAAAAAAIAVIAGAGGYRAAADPSNQATITISYEVLGPDQYNFIPTFGLDVSAIDLFTNGTPVKIAEMTAIMPIPGWDIEVETGNGGFLEKAGGERLHKLVNTGMSDEERDIKLTLTVQANIALGSTSANTRVNIITGGEGSLAALFGNVAGGGSGSGFATRILGTAATFTLEACFDVAAGDATIGAGNSVGTYEETITVTYIAADAN